MPESPSRTLQFIARPRVLTVVILGYLALHFLLRLSFGPVLGLDDAEQTLFAQHWEWSYRFEQPPLFTWLLFPTFEITGVNYVALAIWRYFWLAVILLGSYRLTLLWFDTGNQQEDRLYAGLATLSLLLIYVIAFFSHHDLTHTTIMTAFIVLGLWQFTRLVRQPSVFNYVLLGVVFAGGMLGKWNYVIFCAALTLACLALPTYRKLVLTPKLLAALVPSIVLVLPTLLFVANLERPYVDIAERALASNKVSGTVGVLGKGTGKLFTSLVVYLLPFLLFAGIFFSKPLLTGWRQWRRPSFCEPSPVGIGLLVCFTGIGVVFLWLLVPTVGAVRFTERWMQPVLFPFPFLLLLLIRLGKPSPRQIRGYLYAIIVFSLIAFLARIGMARFSADHCGSCRALIPFPELAAQIKAAGFTQGTVIADRFHIGGNMRVAFPDSRVIDPHYPPAVWPRRNSQSQCLLVWETARTGDQPPDHFQPYIVEQLGALWRAPDRRGSGSALLHGSAQRTFELTWWLYEQPLGNCR